jgi:hypothetical protein
MMVGTFFVCLWRIFVRRQSPFKARHCRRRGHSCHKATQNESAVTEEKSSLIDHQDPPPEYEAPPVIVVVDDVKQDQAPVV